MYGLGDRKSILEACALILSNDLTQTLMSKTFISHGKILKKDGGRRRL